MRERYHLIDAIRGLAVIAMIVYHLCYDIFVVFGVDPSWVGYTGTVVFERCICCTFILVSGISLHFSSHPYRRGIIVGVGGLLITVATWLFMPDQMILWGVLSFIAAAMLLTSALRPLLQRVQPIVGAIGSMLLFAVTYGVPGRYVGVFSVRLLTLPDALYVTRFLAPIGLPGDGFRSADYFPLVPWVFLFLTGWLLWRVIQQRGAPHVLHRQVPVLGFIGRHSLVFYMLHQPVLYGICWLIFR